MHFRCVNYRAQMTHQVLLPGFRSKIVNYLILNYFCFWLPSWLVSLMHVMICATKASNNMLCYWECVAVH